MRYINERKPARLLASPLHGSYGILPVRFDEFPV